MLKLKIYLKLALYIFKTWLYHLLNKKKLFYLRPFTFYFAGYQNFFMQIRVNKLGYPFIHNLGITVQLTLVFKTFIITTLLNQLFQL